MIVHIVEGGLEEGRSKGLEGEEKGKIGRTVGRGHLDYRVPQGSFERILALHLKWNALGIFLLKLMWGELTWQ